MLRPYTDAWPSPIHLQVLPCDQSVRLEVPLARRPDHLRRQRRGRRVAVPLAFLLQAGEIIAQRLLVEARLALAGPVAVRRPEPRGVGREDLVDHERSEEHTSELQSRLHLVCRLLLEKKKKKHKKVTRS